MKLEIKRMFMNEAGAGGVGGSSMFMSGSGFAAESEALDNLQSSIETELDTIDSTLTSLSDSWQDNNSAQVLADGKSLVSELKTNIESVISSYQSDLESTSKSAQENVYTYGSQG